MYLPKKRLFGFSTKFILLILLFTFIYSVHLQSQEINKTYLIGSLVINSKDEADPDNFHEEVVEAILLDQINKILTKKGFDSKVQNELLKQVASDQAEYMASIEDDNTVREENIKKTINDRLLFYGGSKEGIELATKANIKKGKIPYTYAKIADDIVFDWFSNSKKSKLLEGYEYNLIGISAKLDERKRKVYVSVVLGNYKTFNEGPNYLSNLNIPYSQKTYGLTLADPIYCKKVNRNESLMDLQKGLSVENNVIYFETNDLKSLKRLIDKKKDGLAIDILQKEQFTCANPNIVDHNLINQGILTKRVFSKKLFKSNLIDTDEKSNAFRTQLAMLPEGLSNNYELNLVVIKNKSICEIIPQSFIFETSGKYSRHIKLLADTVTINSHFQYKPIADSLQLSFRIPFENNKYNYKTEDIEPFLKLLNEPAFLIYDLGITAYSSIEGTDRENKTLQQKRAESIIKALEDRQNKIINTRITTSYNWDEFKTDIQQTSHNIMASMELKEAQAYIRDYNLNNELEPILQNHRYAQIDMKVTFDISGENEQPYVLKKFNKSIAEGDRTMALSIQKYIMKQVLNYRYKPNILAIMNIPNERKYSGLIMNKIWLQHFTQQIDDAEFATSVQNIYELDPNNEYIAFNNVYLRVKNYQFNSPDEASGIQTLIDRLYYTPIKKETVDGLNIKFQFRIINYTDSIGNNDKLKEASIERIKQIVNIYDETLQNTLKLAEIFIENEDYAFALKTLEPWIQHPEANEDLLFAYVSLCSRFEMRMHSEKFNYAMTRCQEINPKKYCQVLNGNYFSLKVFENKNIKDSYCKYCNTAEKMVLE